MQIFNKFEDLPEVYEGCAIALGTFDGIHLGHVDIIKTAKKHAKNAGTKCIVFSFVNHPMEKIAPAKAPLRLCSEDKKKELLSALGVDILFNIYFDKKFASVSSSQFVSALQKFFSPGCIVVGDNYSYGHLGAGTAQTLKADGKKYGFAVIVRKLVTVNEIVVSSSNIRRYILNGDMDTANNLLGRYYTFSGKVVKGNGRGKGLGYPTANLEIQSSRQAIPADGVYAVWAKIGTGVYPAVTNIGNNPTFITTSRRLETTILNFSADIYGENIEIIFVKKLRSEEKFPDKDALITQIEKDIAKAGEYLKDKENICF